MLKRLLLVFSLLSLATSTSFGQQAVQDVVYLKDGSIVRGVIIEQVPNVSLKLKTRDGSIFVYNMDSILKITKEPYLVGLHEENMRGHKSPGVAFVLSFVFPGLGQYYNGDVAKGVIQEVVYIGGWTMFFIMGEEEICYGGNYWDGQYYQGVEYCVNETTDWYYIGLGVAIGAHIWSMIDAPISASNINEKNEQNYGHLLEFKHRDNTVGLDLGATSNGLVTTLSYDF